MKNKKTGLKEIIAYEKSQSLPLNFTFAYIVTPIYAVICFILIAVFGILMEIDDEKYLIPGLLCLALIILISIVLFSCLPIVRKKAIDAELKLYDFDFSNEKQLDIWDLSTDEFSLKFDKNGMYVDDELFYYNHLHKTINTSNLYKRIDIFLKFALSEDYYVTIPIDPSTLKMLETLKIKLENQHILNYILHNKEDAFKQIYNKGYVVPKE